ncbi:unnamed protein product [Mytilus edulis]|uniref:EGF-like domain-containing protein n=1 Tax=Mytilus edulis TaxID=6550 RepID=A0A8S3T436_MYTED|nr:unnamed protein product [Mytilus edulis]
MDCNNVNGSCTCKNEWKGANCDMDINECDDATTCDSIPDSTCQNSVGSYDCVCNAGYQKNASNLCGSRFCFFSSQHLIDEDIDECGISYLNNCSKNASCFDTDGSFYCVCDVGYSGQGDVKCTETTTEENTTQEATTQAFTTEIASTQETTTQEATTQDATTLDAATHETTTQATTQDATTQEATTQKATTQQTSTTREVTTPSSYNKRSHTKLTTTPELTSYYSSSAATNDNFIKVVVYRIRKGSLVVQHAVILNSTSTTGQNQVAAATNKLVNGGAMLTFAGLTSPAAAGATTACHLYCRRS